MNIFKQRSDTGINHILFHLVPLGIETYYSIVCLFCICLSYSLENVESTCAIKLKHPPILTLLFHMYLIYMRILLLVTRILSFVKTLASLATTYLINMTYKVETETYLPRPEKERR